MAIPIDSAGDARVGKPLYTADAVRQLDQRLMIHGEISAFELMQRAGAAVFRHIVNSWPQRHRMLVFCGSGNNGGDGAVIASLAKQAGWDVLLIRLSDRSSLQGEAAQAATLASQSEVAELPFAQLPAQPRMRELRSDETVVVDALLGTGFQGVLRESYSRAVTWINNCAAPVMAVDVPSGLNSDTGCVDSIAVQADITVMLVGRKQGLYTAMGPEYAGHRVFEPLAEQYGNTSGKLPVAATARAIDAGILPHLLSRRSRHAHKGDLGHVVVLGGDRGLGGAAILAAQAAARAGAGKVSLLTRKVHLAAMLARQPEVMARGIENWSNKSGVQLQSLLSQASVLVIGPGLGQSEWSHRLLQESLSRAVQRQLPAVLDADALNLLARETHAWEELAPAELRAQWILTPHPGEAARLLSCQTADIQADRFKAVRELQTLTGTTCMIKGAGSVLAFPPSLSPGDTVVGVHTVEVCTEGNPGMASGGMGDVLAGLIGGLRAQGMNSAAALRCAVCVHGEAADVAVMAQGEYGLLASDLLAHLGPVLSAGLREAGRQHG